VEETACCGHCLGRGYLRHLAVDQLRFLENGDSRLTLYTKNEGSIELRYRYSQNPTFMGSGDRHDGFVQREWEQGDHPFINSFFQNREGPGYANQLKTLLNLSEEDASGLEMKSRLYYAFRCRSREADDPPLGVILLESEEKDRFTEDEVRKAFERDETKFLAGLLQRVVPSAAHRR
jgi:hypothetical protein